MSLHRSVEPHSIQRGGLEFGDLHDDAIDAQERAVRHLQNSGEPVLGSYLTQKQDPARAVQTELEVDSLESTVQPFFHGKLVDPDARYLRRPPDACYFLAFVDVHNSARSRVRTGLIFPPLTYDEAPHRY